MFTPRLGIVLAGAALLVCVLVGCKSGVSESDIVPISLVELRSSLRASTDASKVMLVDPRPPRQFRQAHLPGAMSVQLPEVTGARSPIRARLREARLVVVYGNNPGDVLARAMTKRLLAEKIKTVRFFAGGISEWTLSGMSVEREATEEAPTK